MIIYSGNTQLINDAKVENFHQCGSLSPKTTTSAVNSFNWGTQGNRVCSGAPQGDSGYTGASQEEQGIERASQEDRRSMGTDSGCLHGENELEDLLYHFRK